MSNVRHIDCSRRGLPGFSIRKPNAFGALADGRLFYGKTGAEDRNPAERTNPVWLANEYVYYAIAAHSGLRMPTAAILCIEGKRFWGSEYIQNRKSLSELAGGGARESGELLKQICGESRDAVFELARALLLDVALLNNDRQPWNMLSWTEGLRRELFFFDHEKTLIGDGRREFGLLRISETALNEGKIHDYLQCVDANNVVLRLLNEDMLRKAFESLSLNAGVARSALLDCPREWMAQNDKDIVLGFLPRWWDLLRDIIKARGVCSIIRLGKLEHS